jgi:hypothetical protein
LLVEAWQRRQRPVRLLGVGYRLSPAPEADAPGQLPLW